VASQVGRMLRCSARGEIGRCAADHQAMHREAANDQTRFRNRRRLDRQVKAFLHQIRHAIGDDHLDAGVRMQRRIFVDHRVDEVRHGHRGV